MPLTFEVCADAVEGVLAAEAAGAHRIELCAGLSGGNTTASAGLLAIACARSRLPVHALIRPRGGDFVYADAEVDVMLADIAVAKTAGAAGVALGALTPGGAVDVPLTRALIGAARPVPVTFHRAFDFCHDPFEALESLVALGISRLLTAGQDATALEGACLICDLVRHAGSRIAVVPSGGITARNVARVLRETGAREVQLSLPARGEGAGARGGQVGRALAGGNSRTPGHECRATATDAIREVIAAAAAAEPGRA